MEPTSPETAYTTPPDILDLIQFEHGQVVQAGHMAYDKRLVSTAAGDYFVKTSDDRLLTDSYQAQRMWEYLVKEQFAYDLLAERDYPHRPEAQLQDRSLILTAYKPEYGWHWEAPLDNPDAYIRDVLGALADLQTLTLGPAVSALDPESAPACFIAEGWQAMDGPAIERIFSFMEAQQPHLYQRTQPGSHHLAQLLLSNERQWLTDQLTTYARQPVATVGHFDARQSNIAWHPDQGVRLVDWSWFSAGPPGSDSTMFLIDLHKSGIDVSPYLAEHFDPQHALLLIGYWLMRSIQPATAGSSVRFHQLASAVSAGHLLSGYN